jgi:hypothetical protein
MRATGPAFERLLSVDDCPSVLQDTDMDFDAMPTGGKRPALPDCIARMFAAPEPPRRYWLLSWLLNTREFLRRPH